MVTNTRFEALKDICGILMESFLSPNRSRNNSLFDIQWNYVNFLDKLESEHKSNSVWKM
jgi:hypothetical protein